MANEQSSDFQSADSDAGVSELPVSPSSRSVSTSRTASTQSYVVRVASVLSRETVWASATLRISDAALEVVLDDSNRRFVPYDKVHRVTLHPKWSTVFGLELRDEPAGSAALYFHAASIRDMMAVCDPVQDYMRRTRDAKELVDTRFVECVC